MSPIVVALLRTTVLPAVLAGVAILLCGGNKDPMRARIQAFALALAYVLGSYLLLDRLVFPPTTAGDALQVSAILLGVFVAISPKDVGSRYAMRAVFVLLMGAVLLWPLRASLNNAVNMRNMFAFFCLGLGAWSILERSARQVHLPSLLLLPLIAATGTSLLLLFSGSASYAQMLGILCALIGAALAVALVKPTRLSPTAVLPFISIFVILFMVAGHFYLDRNPWHFIYLCWPFAVLWLRQWIPAPKAAIPEAIVLGAIGAAPVAYFLADAYKSATAAGPLF